MRITRPISLVTFVYRPMQNPTDTYPGFKTEDDRKAALTVSPLSRRCVQTPRSFSTGNYSGSSPHCHPLGVASHSLRSGSSPPKLRGTLPPKLRGTLPPKLRGTLPPKTPLRFAAPPTGILPYRMLRDREGRLAKHGISQEMAQDRSDVWSDKETGPTTAVLLTWPRFFAPLSCSEGHT